MYGNSNGRCRLVMWFGFHGDEDDVDRRGFVWSCPSSLMVLLEVDDVAVVCGVDLLHGQAGMGLWRFGCGRILPHFLQLHASGPW